jgi:single-strand DNA-binding protein
VILVGRVVNEPEMKFTPSGKQLANFTMAVDRTRPNAKGEKETDFIRIVVWDKLAEICGQYLTKGKLIIIDGRLQTRSYEVDGQQRKTFEVVANDMRMLGSKQGAAEERPSSYEAPPKRPVDEVMEAEDMGIEDIPF